MSPRLTRRKGFSRSVLLYGVVLLYWLTRLIALDSLAFFIDEANHMWWARQVWSLHPFQAASDGRLLNVLWMAAFWPFNAGVWLPRASVVLVTTAGLACTLAFTHRLISLPAAVIAGLLYSFLPLTFFFERMALADSISAPFVAGALWCIARFYSLHSPVTPLVTKNRVFWAALGGLALTAAIFSKISNLIFLGIPAAAAVILFKPAEWRRAALLVVVMYAGCFLTLAPSAWVVKVVGQSDLGLDLLNLKTQVTLAQLPQQIKSAGLTVMNHAASFIPFPMWLIVLIGVAVALWRRGRPAWFVTGVLAATVAALIGRTSPGYLQSRFLPVYAPMVAIVAGAGLACLAAKWKPIWLAVGGVALLGLGFVFAWRGWTQPTTLSLPLDDRWQYITGWPSGYGFREIAENVIARDEPATLVTLDLGGQERFDGYLLGRTDKVTAKQYRPGMSLTNVLLVIDTPKDDQDLAAMNLTLTEIARYPRPGGESALVVYRVTPPPSPLP